MTVLSLMQSDVMSRWDMSYDEGKQGFGWVSRMGFLLCWTKNDSLKKTKAALSQLHKISPCSRWTLFVSWFLLPEFVRNLALLSSCHLVHPSEVFSITERSWEKNCWLLEGLTFKKKKKDSVLDWCFHHIFSSSRKQQFTTSAQRTTEPTLINIVSVWQRGNKNNTKKWMWENLVCSSWTAELPTGES